MAKNIIADTGFWFALYEPRDRYFKNANQIFDYIVNSNLFIPWPTLYETMNTRFVKHKEYMHSFELFINKPNIILVNDEEYRDKSVKMAFEMAGIGKRPMSLVDIIIREMLSDSSYKIDFLLTFNNADFYDICKKRKVEIIS